MSDEASGPEDDIESEDSWKRRMATLSGIGNEANIEHTVFREIIKPDWRSEDVSVR